MNYLEIYNRIEATFSENKELIYSAMFIGSNYRINQFKSQANSDLDVLIILNEIDKYDQIVNAIKNKLRMFDIDVVDCWGVVSQNNFQKDIVHLLIDPIWHFKTRKILFRKSLEQYPINYGNSLENFIPKNIEAEEFLYFGPHRMLEKLEANDWESHSWQKDNNIWYLAKVQNDYANEIGYIQYACIHSIINTIRFISHDLSPIDYNQIKTKWQHIMGPRIDYVDNIVQSKISKHYDNNLNKNEACDFLRNLCYWIENNYL